MGFLSGQMRGAARIGVLSVFALMVTIGSAGAAESVMCADINSAYANVELIAGQSLPLRTYTSSQFALGDKITITVTSSPTTGGMQLVNVDSMTYPGDDETLDPADIGLQDPGTATGTVVKADGADIAISAQVSSMAPSTPPFAFSITCVSADYALSPAGGALYQGRVDSAYTTTSPQAIGGTGSSTYAVTDGALPGGLTLNTTTGVISGTPTTSGTFNFEVTATDSATPAQTASQTYSIQILAAFTLSPAAGGLPAGVVGLAYDDVTLSTTGGTMGNVFVLDGDLPPGLSFDQDTGTLSGTPTTAGIYDFTITVYDGDNPGSVEAAYSITVTDVPAAFTPAAGALTPGMVGEPFSLAVNPGSSASGLTFSLASGQLPDGLSLDHSTGVISGTPTAEGSSSFTIAVSGPVNGSVSYTLSIVARAVTAANKTAPTITPGSTPLPVDLTENATGGPFTGANVVSVTPPIAGTARINMGDVASAAPVVSDRFYLKFTPNPAYSGTAVVTYTLISPLGISNQATVTFTAVLNVPLVQETFGAMGRTFVGKRQGMMASAITLPGLIDRRNGAGGDKPLTASLTGGGGDIGLAFSSSLSQARGAALSAADSLAMAEEPLPFDVWIDGALALHQDSDDGQWGHFSMVTVGADYLVNDDLLLGLAVSGDVMLDPARGGTTRGTGFMVGPYLSAEIVDGIVLDISAFYGRSYNTTDNSGFSGTFDTERLMAKAKLEGQWVQDALTLRPSLNFVLNQEVAAGYDVTNAIGEKVSIAGFTMSELRMGVGGSASYDIALENGAVLTPGVSASLGSMGDWSRLFSNAYGSLGGSLTLSDQTWRLGGTVTLDADTKGARAVSARGNLAVQF